MTGAAFLVWANKCAVAVSIEGGKLRLAPRTGSAVPSDLLIEAKILKQDIIGELHRRNHDFVPIGRECPISCPADNWHPGEVASTVAASQQRSSALWCAHCGRFPDQTQEGEVYAVGASFYCAECCKF